MTYMQSIPRSKKRRTLVFSTAISDFTHTFGAVNAWHLNDSGPSGCNSGPGSLNTRSPCVYQNVALDPDLKSIHRLRFLAGRLYICLYLTFNPFLSFSFFVVSSGHQPTSDGLHPSSDGLAPKNQTFVMGPALSSHPPPCLLQHGEANKRLGNLPMGTEEVDPSKKAYSEEHVSNALQRNA